MVKEDTVMRKKGLMVLGLTVAMSLSLPLLSYAQPQGIILVAQNKKKIL